MYEYVTGDIFTARPLKQTLKAWEPFWDCVGVLFEFQHMELTDGDEELPDWKLPWVAGIALLRTIGHVLVKVDAKKSLEHSRAIERLWQTLKSDRESARVFWDFIENERNNLLKTYTFGARLAKDDEGYYVEFNDGSDAFQMFRQAVYCWRHHLSSIEAAISN